MSATTGVGLEQAPTRWQAADDVYRQGPVWAEKRNVRRVDLSELQQRIRSALAASA